MAFALKRTDSLQMPLSAKQLNSETPPRLFARRCYLAVEAITKKGDTDGYLDGGLRRQPQMFEAYSKATRRK